MGAQLGLDGRAPLTPGAAADDDAERCVQQRYQDWLDEASEHLDGESPRVAAESASLCPRVVELLRELDRAYEDFMPVFMELWNDIQPTFIVARKRGPADN